MIPTELITRALALTGKTMKDVENTAYPTLEGYEIEQFCYYLLSHDFIEKFEKIKYGDAHSILIKDIDPEMYNQFVATDFGTAIYEYQNGNEQKLITLIEKIPK